MGIVRKAGKDTLGSLFITCSVQKRRSIVLSDSDSGKTSSSEGLDNKETPSTYTATHETSTGFRLTYLPVQIDDEEKEEEDEESNGCGCRSCSSFIRR